MTELHLDMADLSPKISRILWYAFAGFGILELINSSCMQKM